jgi:hypothetical protein
VRWTFDDGDGGTFELPGDVNSSGVTPTVTNPTVDGAPATVASGTFTDPQVAVSSEQVVIAFTLAGVVTRYSTSRHRTRPHSMTV